MEHIVLEYDESTRTALVVATSGGREPVLSGHASPYIVADGYDFESRSWGAGHYFTDIAEAKIDYERSCRHPYPLAEGKLRDDEFCTIRWCREDVAAALSEYLAYPIPATEKNIDTAIGQLMFRDGLRDRSTEDGWETIGAIIDEDELDFGISTAQGVDFYKEAFDLSTCTDAVIWPSGDGNAAFVMAYPADSDDGDLAVYKIGGGLIGDDEITVEDIEGLGGTRELCVYKHGFDGIEAIRDFANRHGGLQIRRARCRPRPHRRDARPRADPAQYRRARRMGCATCHAAAPRPAGHRRRGAHGSRGRHQGRRRARRQQALTFFPARRALPAAPPIHFGGFAMNQNMAAAKDSSKLVALRRLSDAELASEIEKDGDAMTELVDAHMSHVHGLGGTEADSAAYYAARKRHADLQFESGRRLHASLNRGKRESGQSPQAMAEAATKAAIGSDGGTGEHNGIKH